MMQVYGVPFPRYVSVARASGVSRNAPDSPRFLDVMMIMMIAQLALTAWLKRANAWCENLLTLQVLLDEKESDP